MLKNELELEEYFLTLKNKGLPPIDACCSIIDDMVSDVVSLTIAATKTADNIL